MPSAFDPKAKAELAQRCWRSPVEFCRIFLPNWFPTKMPWVHRGILALLTGQCEFLMDFGPEVWSDGPAEWTTDDLEKILTNFVVAESPGDPQTRYLPIFHLNLETLELTLDVKPNVAVIMPRGFSKTTVVNAANLRDILYQHTDFFLYISESGAHAERQLATIKRQIAENPLITEVFGDLVPNRQSDKKWTEGFIEPLNGVMVGATGRGGQVRGFSKDAKRPRRIVADDLEDEESVLSETQMKKDSTWFFGTLMPTRADGGQLFAIGTLLHPQAILAKLEASEEWTWVRFGNRDRQGQPLWAYKMDDRAIESKKRSMAAMGELTSYFLEYESRYVSDATRLFPMEKMISLRVPKGLAGMIGLALAEDPAISEESGADFAAFAVVGIEAGGCKHVIDVHAEKAMDPASQVDKIFELYFRYLTQLPPENRKVGIESVAFQRALIHLVRAEQFRWSQLKGIDAYFEVIPILHGKTGKIPRIKGILKPLYHSGYLTFDRQWPELEKQLGEFPTGKKDLPDVIAMAITLLDPYAALNAGQTLEHLSADNAPPLEKVLGGSYGGAP